MIRPKNRGHGIARTGTPAATVRGVSIDRDTETVLFRMEQRREAKRTAQQPKPVTRRRFSWEDET